MLGGTWLYAIIIVRGDFDDWIADFSSRHLRGINFAGQVKIVPPKAKFLVLWTPNELGNDY